MLYLKKPLTIRIISFSIIATFIFSEFTSSFAANSSSDNLRIPLQNSWSKQREEAYYELLKVLTQEKINRTLSDILDQVYKDDISYREALFRSLKDTYGEVELSSLVHFDPLVLKYVYGFIFGIYSEKDILEKLKFEITHRPSNKVLYDKTTEYADEINRVCKEANEKLSTYLGTSDVYVRPEDILTAIFDNEYGAMFYDEISDKILIALPTIIHYKDKLVVWLISEIIHRRLAKEVPFDIFDHWIAEYISHKIVGTRPHFDSQDIFGRNLWRIIETLVKKIGEEQFIRVCLRADGSLNKILGIPLLKYLIEVDYENDKVVFYDDFTSRVVETIDRLATGMPSRFFNREFGKTGLRFFPIHLGTVWFGRRWPDGNVDYMDPSFEEIEHHLDRAFETMGNEQGIIMIDTAAAYGYAEERIGMYFQSKPELLQRAFIATKWGEDFDVSTGKNTYNYSKDNLISSVDRSLEHLKKIGLLYIHGTGPREIVLEALRNNEVINEMKDMKKRHNIRYLGVSISKADILEPAIENDLLKDFDVVQISVDIYLQRPDLVNKLCEQGKTVVINSPIRKGKKILTDKEPREIYEVLLKDERVMTLTGTRHHLEETVGYVGSRLNLEELRKRRTEL